MLLFLAISADIQAQIRLPALVTHHMVLQQQRSVKLWGWSGKLARLTVITSWDNKKYSAKADADGNWSVQVVTPKAGGPYQIDFNDGEHTVLKDILIGEVWVCSGQSNMAMRLKGSINQPVNGFHEALLEADNDQLRVFTVGVASAESPAADVKGEWKISSPATAPDFSAVALWYGIILQKHLKVPIGLVVSSVGGTPARSWMSKEALQELPEAVGNLNGKKSQVLYNAMVAPLTNFGIRGFLWYQGEADRTAPQLYARQLSALVKWWRNAWGNAELPFYFVQIAPWLYPGDPEFSGAAVREQQLQALAVIPNSGMVVTLDLGSKQTIHPPEKRLVAARLAYTALAKTYGIALPFEGPAYKGISVSGAKALITFNNAPQGLYFKNTVSSNFEIAGPDKKFYPAKATITAKGIEVESSSVPQPVAVRYAFKNYVEGDLYNTYGLPASSFRTDSWNLQ